MILQALTKLLLYTGIIVVLGDVTFRVLRLRVSLARDSVAGTLNSSKHLSTEPFPRYAPWFGWVSCLLALLTMFVLQLHALELPLDVASARMLMGTGWGAGFKTLALSIGFGAAAFALGAPLMLQCILGAAISVAMGGMGHAAADESWPLTSRALDAAHVMAVGAWIGGLLFVAQHAERDWRAFSKLATVAAPIVVFSGVGTSVLRLYGNSVGDLIRSDYGQLLLLKTVLVVAALALGAAHRKGISNKAPPGWSGVAVELLVIAGVLVTTSVLTGTPMPGE